MMISFDSILLHHYKVLWNLSGVLQQIQKFKSQGRIKITVHVHYLVPSTCREKMLSIAVYAIPASAL
jgi:hypothetical protein